MKILGGTIDWSATFSGAPTLRLQLDGEPDYSAFRYAMRGRLYFAEHDGIARYFVEDPGNQHGYGGAVFNVVMTDGTRRAIKGPWSGNPGSVRAAGFPDVIDVSSNHCGMSVLVSALRQQLDKIAVPPFDPTAGWGPWSTGWYEINGPRVDFPPGSVCHLIVNQHGSYEPAVLLPDGSIWSKPTTDQRTPARLAELAMLERAKQYIGSGTPPVEREKEPSYDGDDEYEPDVDAGLVTF